MGLLEQDCECERNDSGHRTLARSCPIHACQCETCRRRIEKEISDADRFSSGDVPRSPCIYCGAKLDVTQDKVYGTQENRLSHTPIRCREMMVKKLASAAEALKAEHERAGVGGYWHGQYRAEVDRRDDVEAGLRARLDVLTREKEEALALADRWIASDESAMVVEEQQPQVAPNLLAVQPSRLPPEVVESAEKVRDQLTTGLTGLFTSVFGKDKKGIVDKSMKARMGLPGMLSRSQPSLFLQGKRQGQLEALLFLRGVVMPTAAGVACAKNLADLLAAHFGLAVRR